MRYPGQRSFILLDDDLRTRNVKAGIGAAAGIGASSVRGGHTKAVIFTAASVGQAFGQSEEASRLIAQAIATAIGTGMAIFSGRGTAIATSTVISFGLYGPMEGTAVGTSAAAAVGAWIGYGKGKSEVEVVAHGVSKQPKKPIHVPPKKGHIKVPKKPLT